MNKEIRGVINATVVVGALGYFVDIYDLVLFSIVRVASLQDLGLTGKANTEAGILLLNTQMAGLLLGGFIWGILGDRRGRLSVLFGSILTYSTANIANAFVTNIETYQLLRFIAGVGLAGELGAAVTLVSETLTREQRGYGTAVIAAVGITGAIFAALTADLLNWRAAYFVGGCLGLTLLLARVKLKDSTLYQQMSLSRNLLKLQNQPGQFQAIFISRERLKRFLACVAVGLPCWFVLGLLLAFAPEMTRELGATGAIVVGTAIIFQYAGAALGDLASGVLSQRLRSRNRVLLIFIVATAILVGIFLSSRSASPSFFYALFFALGFSTGYWAVFVSVAAEQFGTNLRATVATAAPNLVRGAVIPMTLAMQALRSSFGLIGSVAAIGGVVMLLSLVAVRSLKDSYSFDLDYLEKY